MTRPQSPLAPAAIQGIRTAGAARRSGPAKAGAWLLAWLLLPFALLLAPPAEACRIIIRPPHPPHLPPPPMPPRLVALQHVDLHEEVAVRDQVALHTLRATFHNPHPSVVEGTYYLEMDPGAEVSRFTMMVNGKEVVAELLDAVKARTIYQNIVNQMRDPALLEYVGSQLLQAKIFPIPANGNVSVTVQYTQSLERNAGVVRINALDAVSRTVEQPIPSVSFQATIESSVPIKSVFSPTHDVDVARTGDTVVKASFEKRDYLPKSWLTLYYTLAADDVGIHALTGTDDGGRKYVMLTCTPKVAWEEKDRIPKDVVFVLDTSGSMAGDKIKQAQNALSYCVNRLNPDDRFNLVDFSTEARAYSETLVKVSPESRQSALKYLERLEARGGTAIAEALERALRMFGVGGASGPDAGRVPILVFLTDGLPTIGERDPDALLRLVKDANKASVRAFAFGVGHDINTRLLDRLAADHGGARDYVAPQEDIEIKVSAFYDKVNAPLLTDVSLSVDGIRLVDVYPRKLPDLFRGSQLVLFGRWEGEGKHEVTLSGLVRGERRTHKAVVDFSSPALKHDLVPRLWATRKVAYLLEDIRLRGAAKEVVDEVVALAKQYGIVTPYTSYLITEDTPVSTSTGRGGDMRPVQPPAPLRDGWRGGEREGNELKRAAAEAPQSGARAFDAAKAMGRLGGGAAGAPPAASDPSTAPADQLAMDIAREKGVSESRLRQQIRNVGSKTFYGSGGVWYDSLFKESDAANARTIKFLSPEYEALLKEKPGIAKYLALGEEMYVVFEGVLYHIVKAD
jgi:Ca-activated chloride channel family protein